MRPDKLKRAYCSLLTIYSRQRTHSLITGITVKANTLSTNAMPTVFVSKKRVPEAGTALLKRCCEVKQWETDELLPRSELLKRVKGVDGLFCVHTDRIDDELLDAAGPNLKAVSTLSVGYDHIDLAACRKRDIPVGFTPDVLTGATAELTVGLLLATSRRLQEGMRSVRDGSWGAWDPTWLCGQGLEGATVGIIGLGRIGFAVAQRIKAFGVEKIVYSGNSEKEHANQIPAEMVSLSNLLKTSDFVLVCCALTKDNAGLMNASAFKKMKKTAVFVNTSRGGIVNQGDLYDALKSGQIWGAGLDVTTPEPLPPDHPILSLDNCIVSPHIGSATIKARIAMSELCAQNIIEALNGRKMPAQLS